MKSTVNLLGFLSVSARTNKRIDRAIRKAQPCQIRLPFPDSQIKGLVLPKSETYIAPGPLPGAMAATRFWDIILGSRAMAKTSPGEFIRQVRTEIGKVVWPTRQETVQTAIMVLILTVILAFFFLGVDAVFNAVVKGLLALAN